MAMGFVILVLCTENLEFFISRYPTVVVAFHFQKPSKDIFPVSLLGPLTI